MADSCAVSALPTAAREILSGDSAMTIRRFPCFAYSWLPLLLVLLLSTSFASAEWNESVLYSFQGGTDGVTPVGGIVFDSAGNLYGATQGGGSSSCRSTISQCGTVFQLLPPAKKGDPWTETVLYVFKGNTNNDGAMPFGGLVIDSSGNLYGTTGYGGTGNCSVLGTLMGCGTVFELSPPAQQGGAWTETVLYSFQSGKDGYLPNGDLVFDSAGNLYGATMYGGGYGSCNAPYYQYCGTVFELSPPKRKGGKWAEKVLDRFAGIASGKRYGDGANPNGGLVLDSKDAIYGTTNIGGYNCPHSSNQGCGIVFKLNPPAERGGAWGKDVLRRFNESDGCYPDAGVIFDSGGNVYGTTVCGGSDGVGTVFELKPPSGKSHSWAESVLYSFSGGNDGANPMASPIFRDGENLYGTAYAGQSVAGTVFRLTHSRKETWTFSVLYGFGGAPDGAQPAAGFIVDVTGSLYSTTQMGGTGTACQFGCGTVFEISPQRKRLD
jgi:uncharacterized repeat protein (TIGR03803 family)